MTDSKALCYEVATWAIDEMGFTTMIQTGVKRLSTDLLPVCKGSAMISLWNDVIKKVKSNKSAFEIRSNLSLEKLVENGVKKSAEVEERIRELKSLEKDIDSIELQLQKHKEDLQDIHLKIGLKEECDKMQRMKGYIFQNYRKYLDLKNYELKLFQKWIEELCNTYEKHNHKTENVQEISLLCSQEIEIICSLLEENNSVSEDGHNMMRIPWQSIGELMKKFPPNCIVSCLQQLTELSTSRLESADKSCDTAAELHNFDAASEVLDDPTDDQFLKQEQLATVQNMLQQWDLECVTTFTEYLVHNRNADNMIQQSETEHSCIVSNFQKYYELAPSMLQLAVDSLDSEIELTSVQGCLRSFQLSVARLNRDIQVKTQARDRLLQLKREIDEFSDKLATNQNKIITITKYNSSVKSKLTQRQMQVLNVAKCQVCQRQFDITEGCNDILTMIQENYAAMGQADLKKLRQVKLDDDVYIPLSQLSLNRYCDTSPDAGGFSYCKSAHSLMIYSHVTPTSLMHRILDAKREVSAVENLQNSYIILKKIAETSKHLFALTNTVNDTQQTLTSSILSKFKSGMSKVDMALEGSQALSHLIKTWYDQPAQYQTPWLNAGGLSLLECKNKLENS